MASPRGPVIDWSRPPTDLDTIAADLRALRAAAGEPSFAEIARRMARHRALRGLPEPEQRPPRTTIFNCFKDGRRRVDNDLVTEIARVLGLGTDELELWRTRLRLARGAADAAAIAVVQETPPAPVRHFVGREQLLESLLAAVRVQPVWISGMPGAGKTQLVLQMIRRYQLPALTLDLRGHHGEFPPVAAEAAQRALLRTLDVPREERGPAAARALNEALASAGKLLVLEDALSWEQVAGIVGDDPAAGIVVTSRRAGPSSAGRWASFRIGGLTTDEVARLFSVLSGGATDPAGDIRCMERLAEVTGGLPLAVMLVGGRLATHPQWTLAEHVDLMARRLASGHVDDELRAELDLSYSSLSVEAATLLRLFADLPVAELGDEEVALLVADSAGARAELIEAGLVVPRANNRIALHSLLRAYGRLRAEETDAPRLRDEAFGRVARHLTRHAWAAYATLSADLGDAPRHTNFNYPASSWSAAEARAWLRGNLSSLLTCAHAAHERGHPDVLFRISEGLSWWLNLTGHHGDAIRLHEAAADVAAELGDPDALAMASLDAGQLLVMTDRLMEAEAHFTRARRLIRDVDELSDPGVAGVIDNMAALIALRQGRAREAGAALRRAVDLHRKREETPRLLSALVNLGLALHAAGEFQEESIVIAEGLDHARAAGHRMFESYLLSNRAELRIESGDLAGAQEDARDAIQIAFELEMPYLQFSGTLAQAEAARRAGTIAEAEALIVTVIDQIRLLRDSVLLATALLRRAEIALDAGSPAEATEALAEVEELLADDADHVQRGHLSRLRARLADRNG